jgi:aminopeptidase N
MKVTEKSQSFALAAPERPSFVVIDPEMGIVGEVRPKVPADMLRRQLSSAPTARGRWLAAQALAKLDDPLTIETLVRGLSDEREFWGVRAECAAALGKIRMPECFESLKNARETPHPKVRRAILNALGDFRTTEAMDAIKPFALRDSSYLVEGEAAHALGRTRQAGAFDVLVDLLERPSWFDVVRTGAIEGLAALRDDRAVPHLAARVRYGHPSRARRAAILALPKLAWDRKVRETLEQQLEDPDPLLRIDAVRALGELGDPKARPALRDRLDSDLDPRVRRRIREAIRDLGEPRRVADSVREEMDKLSADHAELKARLARLEAQSGDTRSAGRQKASRAKRSKAKGARK